MAAPPDRGPPPGPGHLKEGDRPRLVQGASAKTLAPDQTPTLTVHPLRGLSPGAFHETLRLTAWSHRLTHPLPCSLPKTPLQTPAPHSTSPTATPHAPPRDGLPQATRAPWTLLGPMLRAPPPLQA